MRCRAIRGSRSRESASSRSREAPQNGLRRRARRSAAMLRQPGFSGRAAGQRGKQLLFRFAVSAGSECTRCRTRIPRRSARSRKNGGRTPPPTIRRRRGSHAATHPKPVEARETRATTASMPKEKTARHAWRGTPIANFHGRNDRSIARALQMGLRRGRCAGWRAKIGWLPETDGSHLNENHSYLQA